LLLVSGWAAGLKGGACNTTACQYSDHAGVQLRLGEQLLLLAINDRTGDYYSRAEYIGFGLVSSLFFELEQKGIIRLDEKNKIVMNDQSPTGDEALDVLINRIGKSSKIRTLADWIKTIGADSRKFKKLFMAKLLETKMVSSEVKKVLAIFRKRVYTVRDQEYKRRIGEQVRAIVLENTACESDEAMLMSMINACNLTKSLFREKAERKNVRRNMKLLINDHVIGKALSRAVYMDKKSRQNDFCLDIYILLSLIFLL